MNARGTLLGVIDFALFSGEAPTVGGVGAKMVVLSKDPQRACAILVPRVAGLRSLSDLQAVEAGQEDGLRGRTAPGAMRRARCGAN